MNMYNPRATKFFNNKSSNANNSNEKLVKRIALGDINDHLNRGSNINSPTAAQNLNL